jgi:hypothetical protein
MQVELTVQKSIFRVFGSGLGGAVGFCVMLNTRSATNPYALMAILCTIVFVGSFPANTDVRTPLHEPESHEDPEFGPDTWSRSCVRVRPDSQLPGMPAARAQQQSVCQQSKLLGLHAVSSACRDLFFQLTHAAVVRCSTGTWCS